MQIIMATTWNGDSESDSFFGAFNCTSVEAEEFCKKMNAARTSSYSDTYWVSDEAEVKTTDDMKKYVEDHEYVFNRSNEINKR
ncbi:hypothetical protein P9VFCI_191 [Rhizobium phage P9VFCI]|uniref:Uncharacterized protein n=3 Tax=Innesvirus TaxID=3044739 RepID=A0A076YNE7_9CAUD|nr:hypothetical protein P10VF_101 [Rhizobium phage vB_RleM_P10VF]YP_010662084.1 hypothetical protein PP937_gp191 [Rhizobium phage P9VFCI]YP_010662285.1 hypothetical protein PP938_gp135 [Rhizobium phage AF3]AIK68314.1 hypothetical protein P10VF_101 [Rhizobium phage vB_RleM_P10VF]QNH71553.1 hypothetical protein AF3_135 [Rhizobium phage AF3]QNH71974.1 hypothetical protein P9VFCI_191 [Rhizobium phage P9VFCI]